MHFSFNEKRPATGEGVDVFIVTKDSIKQEIKQEINHLFMKQANLRKSEIIF